MNSLIGRKTAQVQRFLENGKRIPVTVITMPNVTVTQVKTLTTDGYAAVQVAVDSKKSERTTKSILGHVKKSGAKAPLFLREIRVTDQEELPEVGTTFSVNELLEAGDIVWVTGISKGKGFAGGVKRYGFRGGPRTHGQSDRERAPGSIGQTTTPGRVYKGKRMAGNMGNDRVTIKNLVVVSVNEKDNSVMLSGLVPGLIGSYVTVVKMGTTKSFVPLLKNDAEAAIEAEEQARQEAEAAQAEAEKIAQQEAAEETKDTETQESTEEAPTPPATETSTEEQSKEGEK